MEDAPAVEASKQLIALIRHNSTAGLAHIGDGCDDATIESAEDRLGVAFPASYRRLVQEFGSWDIAGQVFLSVFRSPAGGQELLGSVAETIDARNDYGMPPSLIVTMFDGMGGLVVLDSDQVDDHGEHPVRVWRPGLTNLAEAETLGADFGSFALSLCVRAIDEG